MYFPFSSAVVKAARTSVRAPPSLDLAANFITPVKMNVFTGPVICARPKSVATIPRRVRIIQSNMEKAKRLTWTHRVDNYLRPEGSLFRCFLQNRDVEHIPSIWSHGQLGHLICYILLHQLGVRIYVIDWKVFLLAEET